MQKLRSNCPICDSKNLIFEENYQLNDKIYYPYKCKDCKTYGADYQIKCPICEDELNYIPYKDKKGNIVHIYSHDNTCPFIAFEFVNNEDLDGFVEYIKKEKEIK